MPEPTQKGAEKVNRSTQEDGKRKLRPTRAGSREPKTDAPAETAAKPRPARTKRPENAENVPEPRRDTADRAAGGGDTDVLLDVPVLKVDEIELEVENLLASVSLQADVLDLLKLKVGADVELGRVHLNIKGVEAQALLKVRLGNVREIITRVLETIDANPQILENLTRGVESTLDQVAGGASEAVGALGQGAGSAVEDVGEGAGSAVEAVGEGAGSAVEDVGEDAGSAVKGVGEGAGSAVEDVGEGAGDATKGAGEATKRAGGAAKRAGGAAGGVAKGAGGAAKGVAKGARGAARGARGAAKGAGGAARSTVRKAGK